MYTQLNCIINLMSLNNVKHCYDIVYIKVYYLLMFIIKVIIYFIKYIIYL